jgi:P22 coat protein - gene protein 5
MASKTDAFIPEIWSAELLRTKEKDLVYAGLANRNYEGEIRDQGDRVHILQVGDIAVNTYTKNSTSNLTIQYLSDGEMFLDIDQANYFAFKVDDIDKAQTNVPFMQEAMRKSAYKLNNAIDTFLAGKYDQCIIKSGTSSSPVDLTSTNIENTMLGLSELLNEANAPLEGRFIVVPPWVVTKAALAGIKSLTDNTAVYTNGKLGRAYGFDFYVSNNVNKDSTLYADCKLIFGIKGETFTFAEQIIKMETYRQTDDGFGDVVKGLNVFGGRVLQADVSGVLFADETAES